MATTIEQLFKKGLKANYVALDPKNESTVYLCTDTRELYVGATLFSGGFRTFSGAFPTAPASQVLYYNEATGVGSYYNGTKWVTVIKATTIKIDTSASDDTTPTTKAVKNYVDTEIADVTGGSGIVTEVESKSGSNGTLEVTKGDGSKIDVPLTGVAYDATYEAASRTITIPMVGKDNLIIALGKDMVVKAGKYNDATSEIWLSIAEDGSYTDESKVIKFSAAALIDIYTSGSAATDTVTVTVSGDNKIAATIKVKTNDFLKIGANGELYVDLSTYTKTDDLATVLAGTFDAKGSADIAKTAADTAQAKADRNEAAIVVLNGDASTAGSVSKALKDSKDYADSLNTATGTRMDNIEAALTWGTF